MAENFEGGQMPLHMRVPKLRGFKNPFRTEYQVVNLDRLSELFPEGGTVGVEELVAAGAVRAGQPVKILGSGDITVAVQVTATRSRPRPRRRSPRPVAAPPSSDWSSYPCSAFSRSRLSVGAAASKPERTRAGTETSGGRHGRGSVLRSE